jgi:V/A-type H+-transporting ATPase subunit B
MAAIVGAAGLAPSDRRALEFADLFEREFVNQGAGRRTIDETFDAAWRLLKTLPREDLIRVSDLTLEEEQRARGKRQD